MRFAPVPYIRMLFLRSYHSPKPFFAILATNYNENAPYKKSVEDVSEETRYILEEFIIERAAEDGVDMSLVKPIIDVDLTACRYSIEKANIDHCILSSTTISTNSTDRSTFANDWG